MNLYNFRTNILFTATLAVGIYFAFWYISQRQPESAFVVKIQKEVNPRISIEERTKLANEKCDNPNPLFDRRYSPFRINPLLIYVSIYNNGEGNFAYAIEEHNPWNLSDISSLKTKLRNIFEFREKDLVYEECSHTTIMKTVMFRAPRSLKYGEVVKVIDAVKTAGAEPIVLQIDDLPN
jgi:Biopolymer transport protein ExbD/TolR